MTRYKVGAIIWGIFSGIFLITLLCTLPSKDPNGIIPITVIVVITVMGTTINLVRYRQTKKSKNNKPVVPTEQLQPTTNVQSVKTVSKVDERIQNQQFLEQVNAQAKAESDRLHNMHESQYKKLDFCNLKVKIGNPEPLTSTEKYFLKALAFQEVKNMDFPIYWTLEYNINYKELITKFIENGYIEISSNVIDYSFLRQIN